ncbi:MAG: glycoside hydrolase family 16 protein [Actinomycetota bacterium]
MADLILPDDGRDDVQPGYGPQPRLDEPGPLRRAWIALGLSGGREGKRLAAVVGAAVLCGAAAVVAIGDRDELDDPTALASRIEAESVGSAGDAAGARAFGQNGAPLVSADDTTSPSNSTSTASSAVEASTTPTNSTSTTIDETTTTDPLEVSVTSTTGQDQADETTSSTADEPSATTSSTAATTGLTTSTTAGASTSTTAGRTSTTAGGTTTAPGQTTTTRPPTTTTTRPPTTTTQAPTTTRPPTTVGNSCASGAEFELVMRDDFNGSSIGGQWLRWDQDTGNAGNGRRMASALSVGGGNLTITAQMINGTLVSGGMNHTHAQTYGKYRFRVRTDVDPSKAMSGVILTWPTSDNHLRDGENNAYETLPHQDSPTRSPFYSFIHKPFASNSGQQEYKIWQADAAQWQTITMEWTPSRISITRDGGETWTTNETGADLIPDVPHRFHIQLDAFKPSMSGVVTMQVDFAEVYRYCG